MSRKTSQAVRRHPRVRRRGGECGCCQGSQPERSSRETRAKCETGMPGSFPFLWREAPALCAAPVGEALQRGTTQAGSRQQAAGRLAGSARANGGSPGGCDLRRAVGRAAQELPTRCLKRLLLRSNSRLPRPCCAPGVAERGQVGEGTHIKHATGLFVGGHNCARDAPHILFHGRFPHDAFFLTMKGLNPS
jgi:hypothetical protein